MTHNLPSLLLYHPRPLPNHTPHLTLALNPTLTLLQPRLTTGSRTFIQKLWQVDRYSCFMINNLKFLDMKSLTEVTKLVNGGEINSYFLYC